MSNKELNCQWQGRSKDRQGWQAESIKRRRKRNRGTRENKEGRMGKGRPLGHPASHRVRMKAGHTEVKKEKEPRDKR